MADLAVRDAGIAANVKAQRASEQAPPPGEQIVTRRFEVPDLNQHGEWLIERLLKLYPSATKMQLWSRLNNVLYNVEFLFLYQPTAVSVAQRVVGNTLAPRPTIQEWFTFVQDPTDAAQVKKAAEFYSDMLRWGKAQDADAIMLNPDCSDVPIEQAKPHIGGRVFERTQVFVALKGKG